MADLSDEAQYLIGRVRHLEAVLMLVLSSLPPENRDLALERLRNGLAGVENKIKEGGVKEGFQDGNESLINLLDGFSEFFS